MKKIAIIGTVGVPANYGGFETLVENLIGQNNNDEVEYTVYCSSKQLDSTKQTHKGAKLKYIPLKANGAQSVPYDILSLIHCIKGYDVVLVMGVSGCVFLPIFKLFYHKKLIVHIDGLEWRRAKWNKYVKKFLKFSERIAVLCADNIIADNKGISDYVKKEYNKNAELIAYGGEHVEKYCDEEFTQNTLNKYKITKDNYSLALCRIEPENNCDMILEAFAKSTKQILFIGNWNKDSYSRNLKEEYKTCKNISFLNAIYDLKVSIR